MKNNNGLVTFRPELPVDENRIDYISFETGTRAYMQALWIAGVAFLVYALADRYVTAPLNIPSYLVAAVVLTVSIAVGLILAEARVRSQKGFNAIETIVANNDSMVAIINTLDDDKLRMACYDAYTLLLRSVYCMTIRRPFTVLLGENQKSHHYEQLLQLFVLKLKEAGIDNIILGSNGPLHRFLQARSAIKMVVNITISQSMYVAVIVLFVLSYATVVIATVGSVPWYLGSGFVTAFAYGIGLLILIAKNTSVPFGSRKSEVEVHERFDAIERKNLEAVKAADYYRLQILKTVAIPANKN